MADYKYAYNGPEEGTAKAVLRGFAISTKTSIEMSKHLKGKTTKAAKALLERIIKQEEALPYTRFTDGVGHKKGNIAAGRYPLKASQAFIQIINSAEANANQAGLGTELKIIHLLAHQASRSYHYGRLRRRQTKATHVEIVVKETVPKKKVVKKKEAKLVVKETKSEKATPVAEKKETLLKTETVASATMVKKEEKSVPKVEKKETPKTDKKFTEKESKSQEQKETAQQ